MPTSFKESQTYDNQLEEVFSLKAKAKFKEGISLLKQMNIKFKSDRKILGLLGTLFYQLEDYNNSSKYFKKASVVNPNSELSSLGLFHSYMELGKIMSALKEITRFCKVNSPQRYKITIQELNDNVDNFNKVEKKLILDLQTFLVKKSK